MALTQSHFRFGMEGDLEATHGWLAAEDANLSWNITVQFLLRFCVQANATGLLNVDNEFQYNRNGAGWVNITTTSSVVKAVASVAFTNGQNCTKRLSGTGTFETTAAGCTEDGTSGGTANDIVASGNSETECALLVIAADVNDTDTIQFRLTRDVGILLDSYAVTPTLTVVKSTPVLVTPGTATLTLTRYTPTVTVSNPITVVPGTATLTTTPYAPTVTASDHKAVVPGTVSLALAAYAPTVVVSDNMTVVPGTASLALTAYSPTVSIGQDVIVTPGTAALALTFFAPTVTVSENATVTPGTASLTLTAFAPVVSRGGDIVIIPGTAILLLTAFPPSTVFTYYWRLRLAASEITSLSVLPSSATPLGIAANMWEGLQGIPSAGSGLAIASVIASVRSIASKVEAY